MWLRLLSILLLKVEVIMELEFRNVRKLTMNGFMVYWRTIQRV